MRIHTFVFFLSLAGILTGLFGSALTAQNVLFAKQGDATRHLFGGSVRSAGDVDADGYEDFIVGSPNPKGIGRARVHSGRDGRVLHAFVGDQLTGFFGVSVSGAGDVNGDGFDDIIVGASDHSNLPGRREGMARVYSGKDGSTLYIQHGFDHDSKFGFSVAGAGDVNKDGFDDFVVGAFLDDADFWDSGSARVFSGKDGTLLYRLSGDGTFASFGIAVLGPGDINNDGFADVLVGAPRDDDSGKTNCGSATLYSGKDGTVMHAFFGDSKDDQLGFSIGPAGDINTDGFADLIIGVPLDDNTATDSGSARVMSGKDGSMLYSFDGESANDWFGWSVSGGGDINKDGHCDLIVGALFVDTFGTDSGRADVYSGKDGSRLYRYHGKAAGDWYGQSVAAMGDVNKDGYADFIIGAERENSNGSDAGSVYVMSGRRLTMWGDTQALPLNQAGQQAFSLDFGASMAGNTYWIFGSVVGMHPGFILDDVHINLIPDEYTEVVMVHTNTSTYSSFRGTLDVDGKASATLSLPAGLPAFPALSLYHAAIVLNPSTGALLRASDPVPLHLHN